MKLFMNMKIATKLISAFIIVAIIAAVVGAVGIVGLKNADKSDTELYENMTVPISQLANINSDFQMMRVGLRDVIIETDAEKMKAIAADINTKELEMESVIAEFAKIEISTEMKPKFTEFTNKKNDFELQLSNSLKLALAKKNDEATASISATGLAGIATKALQESVDGLITMKNAEAKAKSDTNTINANNANNIMYMVIIAGVLIAIALGIFLSKIISTPIKLLEKAADKLALGDVDVNIESKTKDEIGRLMGSFAKMVDNIKGQSEVAEKIAAGELRVEIIPKSNKDVLAKSMKLVVETLQQLVSETEVLTKAAVEGKLDIRGNGDAFKGGYKEIVAGVNRILDSVIAPLNVAAEYMDRISKGDIPPKITDNYKGDFNEIKNNLNICIDAVTSLVTDTVMLSKAAVEGKLDTRADVSVHGGDFGKIVEGFNKTLDAVIEPVMEAAAVLSEISNGNLRVSVKGDYKGDLADIKNAVNLTIQALNEVFTEINDAADQVSSGSSQVSDGGQALSQGTTEQASSIEQLTASITEVAAQTKQNAVNASQANELALKAKDGAVLGNSHMKEMLKSMDDINESSSSISKIIRVIDDIAFQTNMLALNAAVEAARAGQHGKGFAVVAEEVRNLAARSAKAAKETADLVEGSIKKVEIGTKIASNTAESLDQIVIGVSKAATLVGEIAAASNEQATAIYQINKGIEQVSDVVQTNSATAEQSAAASEELSSQAEMLKNMVGKFKLKKDTSEYYNEGTQKNVKQLKNQSLAYEEAAATTRKKPKISLSNTDFGKY
ncbi:methyl-accepting chemotaxis protein [Clostridium sp.]|uniref:HAMP domain-containing methyl-accepting chemotaxis protein n=1 Tax=Clostridium sp. TaxID=1506 RepID=UPI003D6D1DF7